jgi:hypothetical protein
MKKIIAFFILFIILNISCATPQPTQQSTLLMDPDAKIQYYQEQITRYQHLIELEKEKLDKKSSSIKQ